MTRFVQVISVLANGTGAAVKSDSNSGSVAGFLEEAMSWLAKVGDMIWNGLMTFFVKIVQFMLRIVDFLQYFVGKLAGIDTWSAKGDVGNVRLADTDVIFRFLMSDSVMKAFIAIVGLSIVLLIVFTIVAIVKTDYSAATDADGKADGNKRSVMKKTGRALFVMLIVPFVLVFGILGSNAVLASLNNALKGNSTISLGGQIFSASSYEANRYRKYADSGRRTPVDFGTEVLDTVFVPEKGQNALGGLVKVDGTYLFVAPMGYKVGGEINGTTMSVANLYERKKNNEDNSLVGDGTQLDDYTHVGYVRYYWDGQIKKVDLEGNELANAQNFFKFPGLTVEGKLLNYESIAGGDGSFGLYELGYMGSDKKDEKNIINAVYNTWKYNNSVYEKYNSVNAESTTVATEKIVETLADRDNQKAVYTFANAETYGFDGAFAPIEEEYYVMADFVDYALEHGLTFYFVNSSNPLIEWNANKDLGAKGVSEAYLEGTEANGKIGSVSGFVVEYATGIDRYYETRRGVSNEIDGETFIVCTRVGNYYVPVTQSESRGSGFVSSYLADGYTGPIVARGLFDDKGNPTYISNISESEETVVSYYKMIGAGGAIADGIDNIDGGDAMIGTYQKANGSLMAYNSAGFEVGAGNIVFSHVKVDEIYVENGLQYIELHFYELLGEDNQQASNYRYLFSASVIGTPRESDGVKYYDSSVFASSTIFTVNGKAVSALPKESILSNTVKYIYFNRADMSKDLMLDLALGFNGKTASMLANEGNSFYARFKLGFIYDYGTDTVYHLTNGSALIDYNFMTEDGIALANLYRPGDLNIIILLFATILIFTVLFQAVWGLISRIYEIVLMFILYPGFVSTIPIDDGSRFKKWRENVVQKVLGAYGVILGINLFFILLPVVRDATYIFEAEDIPAALQGRGFFGNADFLNRIVYILFLLVLFTLIKTLPGLVAGLVGGSDVYADGGKVKENVDKSVKAVSNVVTGKSLLSAGSKAKDMLTGFIPGGAIAKVAYGAGKKLVDKAKEKAAKASGGSGGAPGAGSGGPGGAGGPGGGPGRSGGDHSERDDGPGRSGGDHSERDDVPPTRTSTVESSDESVVASEPVAVEAESEPIVMREGEVVPIAGEVEASATRAESAEHAAAGEAGEATERTFADLSVEERKKLKKENRAEYDRLKSAHAIAKFEEKERNKAKKELADYAERKTEMNFGQKILAGIGLGQKVVDFKKKKIDKKEENLGEKIDKKVEGKIEREAAKLDRMSSRREHRQRIKEKLDARLVQPVRNASRKVYDKLAQPVKDKFYGSKFYGKMTSTMQKAKEKKESFVAGAKKVGAFVAKGAKAFGKGVAKVAVGTAKVLTFPLRAAKVVKKNVKDTKSKLAKLRETGESAVLSDRKVKIQKPEFTLSQMTGMTISELEKLVNETLAKIAAVPGARESEKDVIRNKFRDDYGVDIYVLANRLEKAIRRKTKIGTHGVPIKKTYVPADDKWVGKSRNVDYDVETTMKASKKDIEGAISNLEKTVSGTFVSEEALKLLDKKTKNTKELNEIRRKNADLERQIKALKGSEFKAGEDYETALNAANEAARELETLVNTFKTDKLNEDLRESIFGAKGSSTAPVDGETE